MPMQRAYETVDEFGENHALVDYQSDRYNSRCLTGVIIIDKKKLIPTINDAKKQYGAVRQDGRWVSIVKAWLRSRNRRSFNGVGVYPPHATCPPGFFNLWTDAMIPQLPECTSADITSAWNTLPSFVRDLNTGYDERLVLEAIQDIGYIMEPRASINHTNTSYGLKHTLENWRREMGVGNRTQGNYIDNGSFIVAMILLGYRHKHRLNSPNLCFNVKRVKWVEKCIH